MADSIAGRVGRIIAGGVSSLIEAMAGDPPEAVMGQAIREIDEAIEEVRVEWGRAIARHHLASTRLAEGKAKLVELSASLDAALRADRHNVAEVTIARQLDIEAQLPVLETQDIAYSEQSQELESYMQALHEADNVLSPEQIALQIKMAIVQYLPEIIRESVKPMERIEGIRIYQVEGLGSTGASAANGTSPGGNAGAGNGGNLANEVVSSALRYRAQAPLVDALLQELGLSGQTLDSLVKPLTGEVPVANGYDSRTGA